ncbi:uncharacterized protein LOC109860631 [Pseudomyrmex gracilis]|uniref:uncharacterized protein LOC109860631 n=1 Tax=Pseudomyrmex gracilis TaxID=219809 RepID=UPI0009956582|nr:uncharacterized protein LOC109860631 [Pseudomyrmex gracilis]
MAMRVISFEQQKFIKYIKRKSALRLEIIAAKRIIYIRGLLKLIAIGSADRLLPNSDQMCLQKRRQTVIKRRSDLSQEVLTDCNQKLTRSISRNVDRLLSNADQICR